MGSFFLLGCGGSKFTVEEDELGLPCKRDTKKGETTRTRRENGTMMNGDSTNKSHENDNGSKETTTMATPKQQVPTYEVKLVNNQLVQHVTMTNVVTGKNSTIVNQEKRDSDYGDNYDDGSRISNFNDESLTRSPSFREYCNTNDSRFEGTQNDEIIDKKSQTNNEIVVSPAMDDISDKKTGAENDDMVRQENENEDTKKNGLGQKLRKAFPIHMIQVVKLANIRRKSSR